MVVILALAEHIAGIDAIVMGHATFDQVLTFGDWPYEGTPLTVLGSTLKTVPAEHLAGKAEVSSLQPGALLRRLAGKGCRNVYVDGGRTIQTFLRAGLIDQLIITTLPLLIGRGIPLVPSTAMRRDSTCPPRPSRMAW